MRAFILMLATAVAFHPNNHFAGRQRKSCTSVYGLFDGIAKAFANADYGPIEPPIKASARHILVKDESTANDVLEMVKEGGQPFSALAQEFSTCPSGRSGGSLGSFKPGTMVKAFDDVIFNPDSKIGELYGPVATQFGYHLIVIDSRMGMGDDP